MNPSGQEQCDWKVTNVLEGKLMGIVWDIGNK